MSRNLTKLYICRWNLPNVVLEDPVAVFIFLAGADQDLLYVRRLLKAVPHLQSSRRNTTHSHETARNQAAQVRNKAAPAQLLRRQIRNLIGKNI